MSSELKASNIGLRKTGLQIQVLITILTLIIVFLILQENRFYILMSFDRYLVLNGLFLEFGVWETNQLYFFFSLWDTYFFTLFLSILLILIVILIFFKSREKALRIEESILASVLFLTFFISLTSFIFARIVNGMDLIFGGQEVITLSYLLYWFEIVTIILLIIILILLKKILNNSGIAEIKFPALGCAISGLISFLITGVLAFTALFTIINGGDDLVFDKQLLSASMFLTLGKFLLLIALILHILSELSFKERLIKNITKIMVILLIISTIIKEILLNVFTLNINMVASVSFYKVPFWVQLLEYLNKVVIIAILGFIGFIVILRLFRMGFIDVEDKPVKRLEVMICPVCKEISDERSLSCKKCGAIFEK